MSAPHHLYAAAAESSPPVALYAGIGVGVATVLAAVVAFFVFRSRRGAAAGGGGSGAALPKVAPSSSPLPSHPPRTTGWDEEQDGTAPPNPPPPALDSQLGSGTSGSAAPTLPSMLPFTLTVGDFQAALPGQGPAR